MTLLLALVLTAAPADVAQLYPRTEKGDLSAMLPMSDALEQLGLPVLASTFDAEFLRIDPPDETDAVRRLLRLQAELDDEYLIPSLLASKYKDQWNQLDPENRASLGYVLASVDERKGELEKARARLVTIPKGHRDYGRAEYLLGVILSDPRYPGGVKLEDALAAFQEARVSPVPHEEMHELAQVAIARTLYAMHRYPEAVSAYEAVPRGSKYWADALFENGFARFRAGDPGGALGSLQALHAPQFEGAFQPESWILKATIYYFNCLYDESRSAMHSFQALYDPMAETLKPLATGDKSLDDFYKMVAHPDGGPLPVSVANWVRRDDRMLKVFHLLDELQREQDKLKSATGVEVSARDGLLQALAENRHTIEQVAGQLARTRVVEAYKQLKGFSDQSEILRFESTKAEKELIEQGLDRQKILDSQSVYRPAMPGPAWNYWKFDGEFWKDEIGYYQYTLKNGCPSRPVPGTATAQTP
jgi:hypothetical protein